MNYLRNLKTMQEWFAQFAIVQDWFSARTKFNPVENPDINAHH